MPGAAHADRQGCGLRVSSGSQIPFGNPLSLEILFPVTLCVGFQHGLRTRSAKWNFAH